MIGDGPLPDDIKKNSWLINWMKEHRLFLWGVADLKGRFLKKIEMKGFSLDEKEAALDFLRNR